MTRIGILFFSALGLYGQWITGFYTAENGKEPPANIPWSKFTHIIHNEAWPNSNGTLSDYIAPSETQQIVAAKPAGKSFLVQIADNGSDLNAFGSATSSATMATFVNSIVNYVNSNGYDGVDIDWEANTNTAQFNSLLSKLRSAMPGKVIAIDVYGPVVPTAAASYPVLDQINVMCYDMDLWSGYSWYNDALINGGSNNATCSTRVSSLLSAGVPASKIGIGIPYYGRRWTGCTQAFQTSCPAGNAKTFFFRDLAMDSTRWQPQYQFYDPQYNADYLSIPGLNEFDSYNGPRFMKDAAAWAKANGLGGFMVFTQEYEYLPSQTGDAQYPLSTALYNAVFGAGPTITTTSLPAGTVGTAYSQVLIGTGSPTWSVVSGSVPAGLSLNSSTGVISGTPTAAGTGNFTVKAANSAGTAIQTLSITVNASTIPGGWYNLSWSNRKAITIDHTKVAGAANLTNFPMLFSVTDANLKTVANGGSVGKADGTDLLFTDSTGTLKINHELESYNPATGQVLAWVQVPSVSPTTDTVIYIYYGNAAAADQQNKSGVWDSNYKGVYHWPNGSALTATDSTAYANQGTITGATAASGEVGGAAWFNGSANIDIGGSSSLDVAGGAHTISVWANWTDGTGNARSLLTLGAAGSKLSLTTGFLAGGQDKLGYVYGGGTWLYNCGVGLNNGGWHYIVVTNTAGGLKTVYVDGSSVSCGLGSAGFSSTNEWGAGVYGNFDGTLDEGRISNVARSADWVVTEYRNQSSPLTFFAEGSQQSGGSSRVATPTFAPPAGPYSSPQSVTISTTTAGASIRYTTDGSTPTSSVGTLYNNNTPVSVSSNLTLKAIAYEAGMTDSLVASAAYTIGGGGPPWYNSSWTNRKAITIDHTKVSGASNLSNFPMLFSVTDANLKTVANGGSVGKADGTDLLFTDSTGTLKINHELESYNPATGQVLAWVQVPSVSPTTDTVIYIYYGNAAAADQQNKTGVWDSNYKGVYHWPNGTTLTALDSTTNANQGTISGATAASGEVGGAASFNGSANIDIGASSSLDVAGGAHTISVWANWTDGTGNARSLLTLGAAGSKLSLTTGFNTGGQDKLGYVYGGGTWLYNCGAGLNNGAWHSIVVTNTAGGVKTVYVDGGSVGCSLGSAGFSSTNEWGAGVHGNFDGTLDEGRISNVARSADWVLTEYRNQSSPLTFFAEGSQQ